jgi:hypothetical protein
MNPVPVGLVVVLLLPTVLPAQRSVADRALTVAGAACLLTDYSSTVWLVEHGYGEGNPVLGRHPSQGAVAGYFAINLALYAALNAKLVPRLARVLDVAYTLVEGYAVVRNWELFGGPHLALP